MAEASEGAQERASQAATDWFLLLEEDPEDIELRARFASWLAESPLNRTAWAATQRTASLLAKMPPSEPSNWRSFIAAERRNQSPATTATPSFSSVVPSRGWRRRGKIGFAGGLLAAAAGLIFFLAPAVMLRWQADYLTGSPAVRTITLGDGSQITLAPDSAIAIHETAKERRVTLLAGEAFFDVIHDSNRPFSVLVNGVESTDIGTAFDIRRRETGATVSVQQGNVFIQYNGISPPFSEALGAGQSVSVDWSGHVTRRGVPAMQVGAWRQHQLIAQDQPMGDVIDQLRPYFSGRIVIADSVLASRPVTGVYNLSNPAEALRGIARAHGATVHQVTPWILFVSGG